VPKIHGEPIDDAAASSLSILECQDLATDTPIEQNEFSVNGNGRPQAA